MPLDPTLVAETRAWLETAAEDLRAARFGFGADPPLLADILFHCQQAAEKALKAVALAQLIFEAILERLPGEVCPAQR